MQGAFDSFAMGNYPYPSSYMGGALPAWPMRAACERLASPRLSSTQLLTASPRCPRVLACVSANAPHRCHRAAWDAAVLLFSTCSCPDEWVVVPVQAMAEVAGLLYNASGDVPCYNVTSLVGPAGPGGTWLFQWCAQRAAQELPYFPATGQSDMFWYQGSSAPQSCLGPS